MLIGHYRFFPVVILITGALFYDVSLAQDYCGLDVTKQCQVLQPEPGAFVCSDAKPIDSLTMIWKGPVGGSVKAWKGAVGGEMLAEYHGLLLNQEVQVSGMGGSPNDQVWEVFAASGQKLGESQFHISCSDDNMDGPEDCGLPAGNGKSDDASLLDLWAFDGMAGGGQTLDCTPQPQPLADDCSFEKQPRPSCESLDKPSSLTFKYQPASCDPAANDQGSKTACLETGFLSGTATILSGNSGLVISPASVEPGNEFTVSGSFGSATVLLLETATGSQELNVHTSCSAPLAVGDVFGGLALEAFNGLRAGTLVNYVYTVSNSGVPLKDVTLLDNKLGLVGSLDTLANGASEQFSAFAVLTETTTNRVFASGEADDGSDTDCRDEAEVTVTVTEACDACKGGVTELLLSYLGGTAAQVTIYDDSSAKEDKVLFDSSVDPLGDIPVGKRPGEDKLNSDISIYINDEFHAKLHTSCSQPIGAGLIVGDFEVIEGRSRENGLMCALDTCAVAASDLQFHDKELRLKLENVGDANLAIDRIALDWPELNGNLVEIKRDGDTIHKGDFFPGSAEVDSGWEGDSSKRTIKMGDSDTLKLKFDSNADRYADYSLSVDFDQGCSVNRTFAAAPDVCAECEGGSVELTMQYLGSNDANVVVYDDSGINEDKVLFQGPVTQGGMVSVSRRPGKDKLNGDISIYLNGEFHFKLHTSCSKPLGPELVVGDFRIDSVRSFDNGPVCPLNTCDVEGQFLDIDDNKVRFPISNAGDADVFIERLRVTWPSGTGYLKKVKNNGATLQEGAFTPPFADFEGAWEGNRDDRRVKAGESGLVEFEYFNQTTFGNNYFVSLDFDQGCSVSRIFITPGDCPFVCAKPITELTMAWQGSQTVDIVAWDGPVGSTVASTVYDVFPGRIINVSGISGSENDVYWEIFDADSGEKLGESRFHLSCSDYDMNGLEDYGKPAGNGKGDDDSYLNSWIFRGMVAAGSGFQCAD